jgi:hypothetical protein
MMLTRFAFPRPLGDSTIQRLLRVFEFLLAAQVAVFVDEAAGLGQDDILNSTFCILHCFRAGFGVACRRTSPRGTGHSF